MNQIIFTFLQNASKNPRTSIAGGLFVLGKWGCPFLATWVPKYKTQLDATSTLLEGAAIWYGFSVTPDAAKTPTKDEVKQLGKVTADAINSGNTEQLTNPKPVDNAPASVQTPSTATPVKP